MAPKYEDNVPLLQGLSSEYRKSTSRKDYHDNIVFSTRGAQRRQQQCIFLAMIAVLLVGGVSSNFTALQRIFDNSGTDDSSLSQLTWQSALLLTVTSIMVFPFALLLHLQILSEKVVLLISLFLVLVGGSLLTYSHIGMQTDSTSRSVVCIVGYSVVGGGGAGVWTVLVSFLRLSGARSSTNDNVCIWTVDDNGDMVQINASTPDSMLDTSGTKSTKHILASSGINSFARRVLRFVTQVPHASTLAVWCMSVSAMIPDAMLASGLETRDFGIYLVCTSVFLIGAVVYVFRGSSTINGHCGTDISDSVGLAPKDLSHSALCCLVLYHVIIVSNVVFYTETQLGYLRPYPGTNQALLPELYSNSIGYIVFLGPMVAVALSVGIVNAQSLVSRFTAVLLLSMLIPLPAGIANVAIANGDKTATNQGWAHAPCILVIPFIRLFAWAAFIDTMAELDPKKYMLGFGFASLAVGLASFGMYYLNDAMEGDMLIYWGMMAGALLLGGFATVSSLKETLDKRTENHADDPFVL